MSKKLTENQLDEMIEAKLAPQFQPPNQQNQAIQKIVEAARRVNQNEIRR